MMAKKVPDFIEKFGQWSVLGFLAKYTCLHGE